MASVELRARRCGGYVVVVLRGELNTVDAESTGSAVAELPEGGQHLVIDLDALEYIDCHALHPLLHTRETARRAGCDALLAAPRGIVLRLLPLAGVPGAAASAAAASASRGITWPAGELPVFGVPDQGRQRARAPGAG